MSFAEFRAMFLGLPAGDDLAIGAFQNLLRTGCSEREAKTWMAAHIWDFPADLRDGLVMAFATEALHNSGKNAQVAEKPSVNMSRAEYERRFDEIHAKEGFAKAWKWAVSVGWGPRKQ